MRILLLILLLVAVILIVVGCTLAITTLLEWRKIRTASMDTFFRE
jgi:hypothetical protein